MNRRSHLVEMPSTPRDFTFVVAAIQHHAAFVISQAVLVGIDEFRRMHNGKHRRAIRL